MTMIDKTQQREILQRLKSAQKRSLDAFDKTTVAVDLHPGTQIANMWMFIAAGYSGVEQSFKFLLATEKGMSIEELLNSRDYRTHNLSFLFTELDNDAQQSLSEHYEIFQSLHDYIDIVSLQKFLSTTSGSEGRGYEQWRYTLIELKPVPTNSVECMLSIWHSVVQLIEERQYENQKMWTPERELLRIFQRNLDEARLETSVRRQNAGMDFEDDTEDLRKWWAHYGHPLNAFAELIWRSHRGMTLKGLVESEWLAEALRGLLERIRRLNTNSNRSNLRYFIARAEGNAATGLGIRWNKKRTRFESIPWNMLDRVADKPPDTAQKMEDAKFETRTAVLRKVYGTGFGVQEHGSFKQEPEDEAWRRTLYAEKEQASGTKLTLAVWEKTWDPCLYADVTGDNSRETDDLRGFVRSLSGTRLEAQWLPAK